MSAISRLYTWNNGDTIEALHHNSELNQIVGLLNGGSAFETTLQASGISPTLTVANTGGGPVARFLVGVSPKVVIDSTGRIDVTGLGATAPLVVHATAAMVANLDADKLDGKHLADVLQILPAGGYQFVKQQGGGPGGVALAQGAYGSAVGLFYRGTGAVFGVEKIDTSSPQPPDSNTNVLEFALASTPPVLTVKGQVVANEAAPTAASHLTRKDYVDARVSPWIFGAFYSGTVSTATIQPTYIVPGLGAIKPKKLRASFRSGTASGNSVFKLGRYNASGVLYSAPSEWSITLPQAQGANVVATFTIPDDVTFVEDDQLRWTCTAAGGHQDVSVFVVGSEGLT